MDYLDLFQKFSEERNITKDRDSHVLIIDSLNRFISVWSAVPALNNNGDHIGGIAGFLKSMGALIRQFDCTRCVLVFDGKGGSQRRRKIFSDYKENRRPTQLNRREFASIEDEQFSMRHQMARILSYLENLPVTMISVDNVEADDTIANLCTSYYGDGDNRMTIVSSDRDFLQLVDHRINVWSPIKKILYTPERIEEEFQFHPNNYLLYRVLTGDASDNIPGIKGLGLKTLQKEFNLKDELSLDAFLEISKEKSKAKNPKKFISEIILMESQIKLNYRLMQLMDSDISLYTKNQIRDTMDADIPKLNKLEFKKMFYEDFLQDSIKDPDKWLLNTFSNLDIWSGKNGTTT